ncbi:MAG: hypothetical protein QXO32_05860 [Candidatus Bathyarchaeia archaeon]
MEDKSRKRLRNGRETLSKVTPSEAGFSARSVRGTVKTIDSSALIKFFSREEGWSQVE